MKSAFDSTSNASNINEINKAHDVKLFKHCQNILSSLFPFYRGCTGNKSILGDGGCNRCDGMVMIHNVNLDAPVHSMLWGRNNTCEPPPKVEYECPENYFYDRLGVLETSIFAQQMVRHLYSMPTIFELDMFNDRQAHPTLPHPSTSFYRLRLRPAFLSSK